MEERGLQVLGAAMSILETANTSAALAALVGLTGELFDVEWSALVDLRSETCVQRIGDVPGIECLLALVSGGRGVARGVGTTGAG
jgi:hypothetical protein